LREIARCVAPGETVLSREIDADADGAKVYGSTGGHGGRENGGKEDGGKGYGLSEGGSRNTSTEESGAGKRVQGSGSNDEAETENSEREKSEQEKAPNEKAPKEESQSDSSFKPNSPTEKARAGVVPFSEIPKGGSTKGKGSAEESRKPDDKYTPERHLPTPGQRGRSPQRHTAAPTTTDTGKAATQRANPRVPASGSRSELPHAAYLTKALTRSEAHSTNGPSSSSRHRTTPSTSKGGAPSSKGAPPRATRSAAPSKSGPFGSAPSKPGGSDASKSVSSSRSGSVSPTTPGGNTGGGLLGMFNTKGGEPIFAHSPKLGIRPVLTRRGPNNTAREEGPNTGGGSGWSNNTAREGGGGWAEGGRGSTNTAGEGGGAWCNTEGGEVAFQAVAVGLPRPGGDGGGDGLDGGVGGHGDGEGGGGSWCDAMFGLPDSAVPSSRADSDSEREEGEQVMFILAYIYICVYICIYRG